MSTSCTNITYMVSLLDDSRLNSPISSNIAVEEHMLDHSVYLEESELQALLRVSVVKMSRTTAKKVENDPEKLRNDQPNIDFYLKRKENKSLSLCLVRRKENKRKRKK